MRRLAALLVLLSAPAALAAGPTPPRAPAPIVKGYRTTPPPAWVETRKGSLWLAYASFCWTAPAEYPGEADPVCKDYPAPATRTDLPAIVLRRGELVHLQLGFVPQRLTLTIRGRTYELAHAERTVWRAQRAGVAVLAGKTGVGFARYAARFELR